MHGVAERVEERAEARRDHLPPAEVFKIDDVLGGHDDIIGERAVEMNTLDADVLADMLAPGHALVAVAAGEVHLAGDVIANAHEVFRDARADTNHLAAELVADGDGLIAGRFAAMMAQHLALDAGA